ncbi:UNVERIFIED_CONTAM: hypothetical protein K2H54_014061 [Gekko kuhli]
MCRGFLCHRLLLARCQFRAGNCTHPAWQHRPNERTVTSDAAHNTRQESTVRTVTDIRNGADTWALTEQRARGSACGYGVCEAPDLARQTALNSRLCLHNNKNGTEAESDPAEERGGRRPQRQRRGPLLRASDNVRPLAVSRTD